MENMRRNKLEIEVHNNCLFSFVGYNYRQNSLKSRLAECENEISDIVLRKDELEIRCQQVNISV